MPEPAVDSGRGDTGIHDPVAGTHGATLAR
jgi:hypothetical protein